MLHRLLVLSLLALFLAGLPAPAHAAPGEPERAFAAEIEAEGGPSAERVLAVLEGAKVQQSILDAIARPAERTKPWKEYRLIFLTERRTEGGVEFLNRHRALLERIGREYGVSPAIVTAIIGVETSYGQNTGSYRVLDALYTLGFHYPPRATYFRGELKRLFLLGDGQLAKPIPELRGSYAGAMGWGQFMPTSIANWARDEDGDGRIDLWDSMPDISASVANYFRDHGWQEGAPVAVRARQAAGASVPADRSHTDTLAGWQQAGWTAAEALPPDTRAGVLELEGEHGPEHWFTFDNFGVIMRYNRSPLYAMAVLQLAREIAEGSGVAVP